MAERRTAGSTSFPVMSVREGDVRLIVIAALPSGPYRPHLPDFPQELGALEQAARAVAREFNKRETG